MWITGSEDHTEFANMQYLERSAKVRKLAKRADVKAG
jgi:hypothetical protein